MAGNRPRSRRLGGSSATLGALSDGTATGRRPLAWPVAATDEQAREGGLDALQECIRGVSKTRGVPIPTKESFVRETGRRRPVVAAGRRSPEDATNMP